MGEIKTTSQAAPHALLYMDMERCWWQPREMQAIRQGAYDVVKAMDDGGDFFWEKLGQKPYRRVLHKVYKSCVAGKQKELSPATRNDLDFWVGIGHTRRGLERCTVAATVGKERRRRRSKLIENVLFVQERCWEEGLSYTQTAKLTRVASERESTIAARFAALLGSADAAAVRNDAMEQQQQQQQQQLQTPTTTKKIQLVKKNDILPLCGYTPLYSPYYQKRVSNSAA